MIVYNSKTQSMNCLLSESFAQIYFDELTPCLIIRWEGFLEFDKVRTFCEKTVEVFKEIRKEHRTLAHFIGDSRKLEVLSPEISSYWNYEWNLAMYNAGGRYLALIVPLDVYAQFNIEIYEENLSESLRDVKTKFFACENEAKVWLKKTIENGQR